MTRLLARLERGLARAESALAALSLLAILGLSLAEIAARDLWHTGVPGADTAIRHLVLWVAFFGAILAVSDNRHVKIDVAVAWLPQRLLTWLARPFQAFSAAVCGALALAALTFWREEWAAAPADEQWVAALLVILPLGFAFLAVHFLLRALLGAQHAESHS